jgi:outer membrane protein insertion porin family
LGISLTRTTIETMTRPGKGSRFELSFDRYGALGGDFDFNAANAEYTVYLTVAEDFLGRISTVRLNSRVGYIFGGGRAPTYERFYMGGRSFRGFEFRTISPKGISADTGLPSDDPVGGTWLFFAGAQYEVPLLGDALTGVTFIDTGTVTDDPGFDEYRVSIGAGIRLYIPQFGDVPIAFDFGFPLLSQDRDQEQVFTFSAELPF